MKTFKKIIGKSIIVLVASLMWFLWSTPRYFYALFMSALFDDYYQDIYFVTDYPEWLNKFLSIIRNTFLK